MTSQPQGLSSQPQGLSSRLDETRQELAEARVAVRKLEGEVRKDVRVRARVAAPLFADYDPGADLAAARARVTELRATERQLRSPQSDGRPALRLVIPAGHQAPVRQPEARRIQRPEPIHFPQRVDQRAALEEQAAAAVADWRNAEMLLAQRPPGVGPARTRHGQRLRELDAMVEQLRRSSARLAPQQLGDMRDVFARLQHQGAWEWEQLVALASPHHSSAVARSVFDQMYADVESSYRAARAVAHERTIEWSFHVDGPELPANSTEQAKDVWAMAVGAALEYRRHFHVDGRHLLGAEPWQEDAERRHAWELAAASLSRVGFGPALAREGPSRDQDFGQAQTVER